MKESPNIAVCDDSPQIHQRIEELLKKYCQRHPAETYHVYHFSSKAELLENTELLDLLYLDIELGKDFGVELVEPMQERFPNMTIMFISTYTKYFIHTTRLNVFQFLIKPFDERIFFEELDRFYNKFHQRHALYQIERKGAEPVVFPLTEILYIEASLRHLHIMHSQTGAYEKSGQISKEETLLKPFGFIRCHHGYLVNARYIEKIKNQTVYLRSPQQDTLLEIPISKGKMAQTKQQYQQWLLRQGG